MAIRLVLFAGKIGLLGPTRENAGFWPLLASIPGKLTFATESISVKMVEMPTLWGEWRGEEGWLERDE